MRVSPVAAMAGLAVLVFFAPACSTTGSRNGSSSGGSTLPPGQPCTSNQQCASAVCGVGGTGNCCAQACATIDATCAASACDATGACSYPAATTSCPSSCPTADGGATLYASSCNGAGACGPVSPAPCPDNFACGSQGSCNTFCSSSAQCAAGFACNDQSCVKPIAIGSCTENDDCNSNHCGVGGLGHCCAAACSNLTGACGAFDCGADSGACLYQSDAMPCGSVQQQSCTADTETDPSHCDGAGNCATPSVDCGPYACGATACLTSCGLDGGCASGAFCEVSDSMCCAGLGNGGTVAVDAANGNDSLACCGLGGNPPCQTLTHVMSQIDAARAPNVTVVATVDGGGGDWNPSAGETTPILLGWGAKLSAPGVYFADPGGAIGVFLIGRVSGDDQVGYASIVGTATNPVWIGQSAEGQPSSDGTIVQVFAASTLYLANADLTTDAFDRNTAINVAAGAGLVLGGDQSGDVTGTVTIGSLPKGDGYNGIVCGTGNSQGCTISDVPLVGIPSVVIENQGLVDLDAEDYAVVTLTSSPIIGVPPLMAGFPGCPGNKLDFQAVLLNGKASVTFKNGTVQCMLGVGFLMQATANGTPTLTLDRTTIQNTAIAISASAGTATVSSSTIQYNANGVEQTSSGENSATIDLSGGGPDAGTNTIICSNGDACPPPGDNTGCQSPGFSVLNSTAQTLDASNVTWDTRGPDLFACDATLSNCTCKIPSCTDSPGSEGMDAVTTSTGTITTTGNRFVAVDCGP